MAERKVSQILSFEKELLLLHRRVFKKRRERFEAICDFTKLEESFPGYVGNGFVEERKENPDDSSRYILRFSENKGESVLKASEFLLRKLYPDFTRSEILVALFFFVCPKEEILKQQKKGRLDSRELSIYFNVPERFMLQALQYFFTEGS